MRLLVDTKTSSPSLTSIVSPVSGSLMAYLQVAIVPSVLGVIAAPGALFTSERVQEAGAEILRTVAMSAQRSVEVAAETALAVVVTLEL